MDLETGAVVAVTLQGADQGDTTTVKETFIEAAEQLEEVGKEPAADERMTARGMEDVVTDKGYHSGPVLEDLQQIGVRSYIPEPQRGRRHWQGKASEQAAVYSKRRRIGGNRGKQLLRRRGELLERSFAHVYDTGRMRRTHLRGASQYLKAAAAARRGVQPEPDPAPGSRSGHTAGPARPPEPPIFLLPGRLDDPEEPLWKLGLAAGNFCGQISDSPVWGSGTERCLKNAISTTAC